MINDQHAVAVSEPVMGDPGDVLRIDTDDGGAITINPALGLISVEVRQPDGTLDTVVGDPDEMRQIALRGAELARERAARGDTSAPIDLAEVVREVLGRDPFAP